MAPLAILVGSAEVYPDGGDQCGGRFDKSGCRSCPVLGLRWGRLRMSSAWPAESGTTSHHPSSEPTNPLFYAKVHRHGVGSCQPIYRRWWR